MWEAIEQNRRRSWLLIGLMAVILLALGALTGGTLWGGKGAVLGSLGALGLWGVLLAATFFQGEQLILLSSGGQKISKEDCPRLFNVVEEMTIAAGLPRMPDIYVIEDAVPNAFAAGRTPEKAVVAVTTELLARLDRDELQGVIAHEIAHVKNLDVRFMTIASVMVGSIVILSQTYVRMMFLGGRRRTSPRGGGMHPALMVAGIVAAILAPIAARMLYFACSRRREYLADASAARFTRYPVGLASALKKISGRVLSKEKLNQALLPMYIVNPLQSMSAVGFFSTHPPTEERIKILSSMGGRAGLMDYENAFRKVKGKKSRCLGHRTLMDPSSRGVEAREKSDGPLESLGSLERFQEVTDLVGRMANLLMMTCMCGVKIKIPEGCQKDAIECPRCATVNAVPRATEKPVPGQDSAATPASPDSPETSSDTSDEEKTADEAPALLRFERSGQGWESFRCSCDRVIQIAPSFRADFIRCPRCKREVEVVEKEAETAEA